MKAVFLYASSGLLGLLAGNVQHRLIVDAERHQPRGASTATNGQVLRAGGADTTSWVSIAGDATGAPDALTVTRLQGRTLASTAPNTGEVLGWSGTQWQPTAQAAAAGDGTNSLTWTVNRDAVVGGNEDACEILKSTDLGGETNSIFDARMCMNANAGIVAGHNAWWQLETLDDSVVHHTEIHLGRRNGGNANRRTTVVFNAGNGSAEFQGNITMENGGTEAIELNGFPWIKLNDGARVTLRGSPAGNLEIDNTGNLGVGVLGPDRRIRVDDSASNGTALVQLNKNVDQDVAVHLRSGVTPVDWSYGYDFSAGRFAISSATTLDASTAPISFTTAGTWHIGGDAPNVGEIVGTVSSVAGAPQWTNILSLSEESGGVNRGSLRFGDENAIPRFGNAEGAIWYLAAHPGYSLTAVESSMSATAMDANGFLATSITHTDTSVTTATFSSQYFDGGRAFTMTTGALLTDNAFTRSGVVASLPVDNRPLLVAKFRTGASVADVRTFIGIMSNNNEDGGIDGDDPGQGHIGIQFSDSRDANWQVTHDAAAGGAAQTLVPTATPPAANTTYHVEIDYRGSTSAVVRLLDAQYRQLSAATISTNLPTGTEFHFIAGIQTQAVAAKTLHLYHSRIALRNAEQ